MGQGGPRHPHSEGGSRCFSQSPFSARAVPRVIPAVPVGRSRAPPSPSFSLVFPKPVMKQDLPVWNRWPYMGRQAGRTWAGGEGWSRARSEG